MKNKFKLYINKLNDAFRHRKILLITTYLLSKIGLQITPYLLTLESTRDNPEIKLSVEFEDLVFGFLRRADIEKIYDNTETQAFASLEKAIRNDNCLCFALKQNEEIMAFMWCDLERCNCEYAPFNLKPEEAYLFGVYTYRKYRGMNMAPYLRCQLLKALLEMGRTRLFNVTAYFNTPAINFIKKFNVRHVKTGLFIKLFFKIKWNIILKEYPT